MHRFVHRLALFVAPLIIQLHVPSVGAETLDQSVSALAILERPTLLDLRLFRPLSRSEESALLPLDRFKECDFCPVLIVIPAGRFTMGASADEPGSTPDERPQHQVTFPSFSVGRLPVSLAEWNACVMRKGCSFQPSDPSSSSEWKPITNIQWVEAKEYVEWLSRATGKPYRLLANRSGSTSRAPERRPPSGGAIPSLLICSNSAKSLGRPFRCQDRRFLILGEFTKSMVASTTGWRTAGTTLIKAHRRTDRPG